MVMLKLPILDFPKRIFKDTPRPRVFAELLNTSPQKFFLEMDMVKLVIGGVLVASSTKCSVVNHHFTVKIKKSFSKISNTKSQN